MTRSTLRPAQAAADPMRTRAVGETFSVTAEPVAADADHHSRRLVAKGALTEVGGELMFEAVTALLTAGVRRLTLDLSALTSVEEAGLHWLRRAWLQAESAGGCLWTVGISEAQRELVPTSRPQLARDAGRSA